MGGENEEAGVGGHGSVRSDRCSVVIESLSYDPRMSVGLGMTPDEWQELRSQVDDSFWVMRVIGMPLSCRIIHLPHD